MIAKARLAVGLTLALIGLGISATAQTALGTLRGVVTDEQVGALPGVTVTARHSEPTTPQPTVPGQAGHDLLPNLRPGKYEVVAELPGFVPLKQQLDLRVGQDLTIAFTLKVAGVAESVEVVASSIPVETQST